MIKDLIGAAILYLSVRAKKIQYELLEESEKRTFKLIQEIESLRGNPSFANTARADFLQNELKREKEKYLELSK